MIRRPPRSPLFPYPPLFRSLELEQERGARREGVAVRLAARQHGAALVHGVARLGYDRDVTPIDEGRREVRDPLLRADQRRSEEHTSELQSRLHLVCRLLLEK